MARKVSFNVTIPSIEEVEAERKRLKYKKAYNRALRSTIYSLLIVAATAVLMVTIFLPVLQVSGTSMEPTLMDEDIILLVKTNHFETGDLCGFYWQNKLLLKRIIAGPGDVVEMNAQGDVFVNGQYMKEPYLTKKALGECDVEFPYQIPENRYFVLGDHRETSIDSRSSAIGCIEENQIVGRVILKIWPFKEVSLCRIL